MRRFLLPIRWRLALTSAALTFVILLGFAAVIAAFTDTSLRSNLDTSIEADASDIAARLPQRGGLPTLDPPQKVALKIASSQNSTIRILAADEQGGPLVPTVGREPLGPVVADRFANAYSADCNCTYRVYTRPIFVTDPSVPGIDTPIGFVQVGQRTEQLDSTIRQVDTFLALGVIVGTGLALLAGLAVARRAMRPVSDLTYVASHVSRTRDPDVTLPRTRAKDEVADLARTLESMLKALNAARNETEATLKREREFVADASHELRTPLTSVLANLEILQAELEGEQEETVEAALRSTQRMRRLVADLLFLANADAGRETPHEVVDLGLVVRDAAAETAPITSTHEVRVEAPTGIYVSGAADDLHRLVVNLIQNAVNHTPAGTVVRVRLRRRDSAMRPTADEPEAAVLEISDNGPGIPAETRARIFERFVRAPNALANESARGGSGLGLAIVNAVAIAHGGNVKLTDSPDGGARFVIRIPTTTKTADPATPPPAKAKAPAVQTSTTTGSTRGRLFRRS